MKFEEVDISNGCRNGYSWLELCFRPKSDAEEFFVLLLHSQCESWQYERPQ